ncbi:MAG: hypothetical protein M0R73_11780 [Dehalococcoidia bacterium]|nr:hypothetical protein [Dehalococcoidia bacterium]
MAIPEWDERYLEYRPNHRVSLLIRAAIFVPAAVLLTTLLVFAALQLPGTIILVLFLGIGALAVDIEAYHTARDLASEPMTSRGRIERQWKKGRFLFFGRVNYLLVSARDEADPDANPRNRLFEVGAVAALELQPGDEVLTTHWPHTNAIIALERVARAPEPRS